MANFKGWEILIILALVLLLFGGKRLPDAARGLGRSMRIFKSEIKAAQDDDEAPKTITATAEEATPPSQTSPTAQPEQTDR